MANTTIIIPTTGTSLLNRALTSALNQTVPCSVLVVIDGPEHAEKVHKITDPFPNVSVMQLPWNVGGGETKLLGHPMYGALPMFVKTEFVAFLDEDNWYDPDHIQNLEHTCRKDKLDWAFSLRKIWSNNTFVCVDNCESLGNIRKGWEGGHLVDTSCFFLRTPVAREVGPVWYHPHADRPVTARLMERYPNFRSSYKATLNYEFQDGNARGQKVQFFTVGNALLAHDFENKPTVYLAHRSEAETTEVFKNLGNSLYRDLCKAANILNAFENKETIPRGSTLLVNMKGRNGMRWDMLSRSDITKVLVMEDPPYPGNVLNWDIGFLHLFEKVISCWKPLARTVEYVEHFNAVPGIPEVLAPCVQTRRTCMLLTQPRPEKDRDFVVNNVKITARGVSNLNKRIGTLGSLDLLTSADKLRDYSFCVVEDFVDAEGYIAREFFDCLIAGVIPIYEDGSRHPDIPKDLYIDPNSVPAGMTLPKYLEVLNIDSFLKSRDSFLKSVSSSAFANLIRTAIIF